MKGILVSLVVLYALFALAFCSMQRKFLYFPPPASNLFGEMNISFTSNGIELSGWVLNQGQSRALIYYGGNAESIEANIPFFRSLNPEYTIYLLPYRGYANNPGKPSEEALYNDAVEIFNAIQDKHESISLMGRSLGSGVATFVAANHPIDRLILVTPFDSVENVAKDIYWMFPVSWMIKDRYASVDRAKEINAKTYIFVAERDRVIPRKRTEQLIEAFTHKEIEVFLVSGANHNNISEFPTYVSALKAALD